MLEPKPFKIENGQTADISQSYVNPFESGLSINVQQILEREKPEEGLGFELQGEGKDWPGPKPRKFKLGGLSKNQVERIKHYREKYGKHLELHM